MSPHLNSRMEPRFEFGVGQSINKIILRGLNNKNESRPYKPKKKIFLVLHFDTNCEIALSCQKKDKYTDSVYSKDTFGRSIYAFDVSWNYLQVTCMCSEIGIFSMS